MSTDNPSDQEIRAANTLLLAKTYAQEIREKMNREVYSPILAAYQFKTDRWPERGRPVEIITEVERLYLSAEDDRCSDFYAECDAAIRDLGYDMPAGHCPALRAEQLVRDAERSLVDLVGLRFETDFDAMLCGGLDGLKQFIDLSLKWVVNAPNYTPPKIPNAA